MEKRKINFEKYADMHNETTIEGSDGEKIVIRNHIPYADKKKLAIEMVERTSVIHDDSCVYMSDEVEEIKLYLIAKYYTDIDVDGADSVDIADYLINSNLVEKIRDYINDDFNFVTDIYYTVFDALVSVYADDASLSKAMKKSFGFLFNGEDITETLAKAEATKDSVFDAFKLLGESEKNKSEHIHNGTLKIDGNIINFAKKGE